MLCARNVLTMTTALMAFSGPVGATESSVPFIDADAVHAQGITGAGATVAVIDSGIDYGDPGLGEGIASGGISIIGCVPIPDGGADPGGPGHGTYMSLIITDVTGKSDFVERPSSGSPVFARYSGFFLTASERSAWLGIERPVVSDGKVRGAGGAGEVFFGCIPGR